MVLVLALAGILYYSYLLRGEGGSEPEGSWVCRDGKWVAIGQPLASEPDLPCQEITENGEPSGQTTPVPPENIVISKPMPGGLVQFPLEIEGRAKAREGSVDIRLADPEGRILYEGYATVSGGRANSFGSFQMKIDHLLRRPSNESVLLEIFELSEENKEEKNKVSLPLRLAVGDTSGIKLFFANSELVSPGKDPCGRVFPVERIVPKLPGLIPGALDLLSRGPLRSEFEKGYRTEIDPSAVVREFMIDEGRARADFDGQLVADISNKCRLDTLRAQILETLKQFPEIVDARFTVLGSDPEELVAEQ